MVDLFGSYRKEMPSSYMYFFSFALLCYRSLVKHMKDSVHEAILSLKEIGTADSTKTVKSFKSLIRILQII